MGVCVGLNTVTNVGRKKAVISHMSSSSGGCGVRFCSGGGGRVQLPGAAAASPPSSTLLPLPMVFILAMMSVNVSFTVFSRIQPSLSLSGSSGLARVDSELLTYCMPTVTATCEGPGHASQYNQQPPGKH